MSSEVKSDGKEVTVETSTPTPDGPLRSMLRVPILSSLKEMANIYLAVGAGGFILIVFLFIYVRNSSETSHLYQAAMLAHQQTQSNQMEAQSKQIEALVKELNSARKDHRQDIERMTEQNRKDLERNTDRYLSSRESAEKRHLEVLAAVHKMDISNAKTNLFMEQLAQWFVSESRKPMGAKMDAPPPKPSM